LGKYNKCDSEVAKVKLLEEVEEDLFDTFPLLLLSLLSRNVSDKSERVEATKQLLLLCANHLNPKELFLILEQHSSPFFSSLSGPHQHSPLHFMVDLLLRGW